MFGEWKVEIMSSLLSLFLFVLFVGDLNLLLILLFGEFDCEDKFVFFCVIWFFCGDVGEGGIIFVVLCIFGLKYNCIEL